MSRLVRRILIAIAATTLLVGMLPTRAATPEEGTISPASPSLTYEGKTVTGAPIFDCMGTTNCDLFRLKVDVPIGYYAASPKDLVVEISWSLAAHDIDLFVCPTREDGNPECEGGDSSTSSGTTSETVTIPDAAPGVYGVLAYSYLGSTSYSGKASLVSPPKSRGLEQRQGDMSADTTGDGKLIASIDFPRGTDLDFRGTLAFVGSYDEVDGGLRIIDIADPRHPKLIGRLACAGYQNDVGVYRTVVVMAMHDSGTTRGCTPHEKGGLRVIDASDPTTPKQSGFVTIEHGGVHTVTVVGDTGYVYANPGGFGATVEEIRSTIVDVRDPAHPKVVGTWVPPESSGCHDISVVGNRAYCAGSEITHIMDVSDPLHPKVISSITNELISYHHGALPSSDGKVLVIADEAFTVHVCDPLGANPTGAFWFYDISDERNPVLSGWLSQTGLVNVGGGIGEWCTAHNFNMVPDRPWMVASAYTGGTSIIDFSDPAAPSVVSRVTPTGADTWSSYFHNGFIFTGDIARGFDVIEHPELTALAPAAAPPSPPAAPQPKPRVRSGRSLPATGLASRELASLAFVLLAGAVTMLGWINEDFRKKGMKATRRRESL